MKQLADYRDFERFLSTCTNYERMAVARWDVDAMRLDRVKRLLTDLGNPDRDYEIIHIAGTKGKGTTALIVEALLGAAGVRVGAYTSPHVDHLRERIRVDGVNISEGEVVDAFNALVPALERAEVDPSRRLPTFFELMTALATVHFRVRAVEWAIFEVGLGGRLDATNVFRPRVTAITSVGLEHMHILGDTIEQIAREKAGIVKDGVPVIIGPVPRAAREAIVETARSRRAPVVETDPRSVWRAGPSEIGIAGVADALEAPAIRGPGLRTDLAISVRVYREALASLGLRPAREAVASALRGLSLPARVELFDGAPPAVVDGAHTEESFAALRLALEEIAFPRPRTLVLSVAADKRIEAITNEAARLAERRIVTRADTVRSSEPAELAVRLGKAEVIEDPADALGEALSRGHPVIVAGSMYLAGRLRAHLVARAGRGSATTSRFETR